MSRYIDADKLTVYFEALAKQAEIEGLYNMAHIYNRCLQIIEDAPTADVVEVVHAYWKETTHITESKRGREIHSKLYNCSNCDAPNGRKKSSYCHWCGAKMDGEGAQK